MKKCISMLLSLVMVLALAVPAYAAGENNALRKGVSPVLQDVSTFLDNSTSVQTISISEHDLVTQLLKSNAITKEDLNNELNALSLKSYSELEQRGYSKEQIDVIKSYRMGEDAFSHVYRTSPNTRSASIFDAEVSFRFGLAGTNTQKDIRIAYDITWSECPFWALTDSFGVGWIAADEDSKLVMTQIDYSEATVQYYDPDTDEYAGLYRNVTMNDFSNCVVIGNPIMGSANGNYGKRIGGYTEISTQSGSYNIYTIQIFVAYGHTMISGTLASEVSLGWSKSETAITFVPSVEVTQEMMVQDKHTFLYSDNITVWPE